MFEQNSPLKTLISTAKELATQAKKDAWLSWIPELSWGTATPTNIVTTARYKIIGKTCFFQIGITADDGMGAGKLSCTLPALPKTNNLYPTVSAVTRIGTSWNTKAPYIIDDGSDNRVSLYLTATAGSTLRACISGVYEID